jgi:mono/diheme cytochrome c family protein
MPHTTNLVQTVMYGGFSVTTSAQPQPFGMPPFVLVLSDRDMADVLTHIRSQWGNTAGALTEFDVVRVREMQTR